MTDTPPPIPIPSQAQNNATHLPPVPLPMPASSSRSPPAFLTSRERERDRAHPYTRRQSVSHSQNGTSPMPPRILLDERERGDYSSMRSTAGPLSPLAPPSERESPSSTSVSASYLQSPHSLGSYGTDSHHRRDEYDSPGPGHGHDLTRSRSRSQSYATRGGPDSGERVAFSLPPLHTLAHFGERMGMPTPPLGEMLPPGGSPHGFANGHGNGNGASMNGNGSNYGHNNGVLGGSNGGLGLAGLRPSYAYDSNPAPMPSLSSSGPKRYEPQQQQTQPSSPNMTTPSYPYSTSISRQASYASASASSSLPTPARSRSHSSASAPGTATMRMAGLALHKQQQQQSYDRYESAPTPLAAPSPGGGVPQNRRMAHLQSEQKRRESINTGFAALRAVLPSALATDSKAIVLRKAVAHIERLEARLPSLGRRSSPRVKEEPEDSQMIYDSDEEPRRIGDGLRRVSGSSEDGKRAGWECVQVEDVRLEERMS